MAFQLTIIVDPATALRADNGYARIQSWHLNRGGAITVEVFAFVTRADFLSGRQYIKRYSFDIVGSDADTILNTPITATELQATPNHTLTDVLLARTYAYLRTLTNFSGASDVL